MEWEQYESLSTSHSTEMNNGQYSVLVLFLHFFACRGGWFAIVMHEMTVLCLAMDDQHCFVVDKKF